VGIENEREPNGLREPPVARIDRPGGAVVIHLTGELDLYNASDVRSVLADEAAREPERIVVDLSAVGFIDSTALGVLVEAHGKATSGAFLLAAPAGETRRALEISGLDRHFRLYDSVEAALSATI
jgi:anti-anti-sigma factor